LFCCAGKVAIFSKFIILFNELKIATLPARIKKEEIPITQIMFRSAKFAANATQRTMKIHF